ncbi:hypothetical protein NHX12_027847 [Muraenolepis orangiensis]|uniref:Uncharacterized protein n=1 Tax=Muraenolepis orangiensis TaxID=630683 RepID=A0A9Q0IPM2_9TELE|nr:hypothetical protein NHX12_027847 [Muraenolepis orangiensis]
MMGLCGFSNQDYNSHNASRAEVLLLRCTCQPSSSSSSEPDRTSHSSIPPPSLPPSRYGRRRCLGPGRRTVPSLSGLSLVSLINNNNNNNNNTPPPTEYTPNETEQAEDLEEDLISRVGDPPLFRHRDTGGPGPITPSIGENVSYLVVVVVAAIGRQ